MIVYQLVARGPMKSFDSLGTIESRTLYRSQAAAYSAIDAFEMTCTTEPVGHKSLRTLKSVDSITVRELELVD
jgi:hypothetical protein